jgi:hypothetical protein
MFLWVFVERLSDKKIFAEKVFRTLGKVLIRVIYVWGDCLSQIRSPALKIYYNSMQITQRE